MSSEPLKVDDAREVGADAMQARRDYGREGLEADDLHADPLTQLQRWLDEAGQTDQLVEPSAMALATVDADGRPALRTVLLRQIVQGRLLFFTSYGSRKAAHLDGQPDASVLFRWADPQRQVEVRGTVARATAEESDAYFATRPRASQLGAHSSPQSRPLVDRGDLEEMVAATEERFSGVEQIPRPDGWGGYALTPHGYEFWQGRTSRLHDRFRYTRDAQPSDAQPSDAQPSDAQTSDAQTWTVQRLAP